MIHGNGGRSPRGRRRQARLQRILDTAMQLVVGEGIEALTLHRLAGELDYTVGALYRYFESKDALLVELQRRAVDDLRVRFEEALGEADRMVGSHPDEAATDALFRLLVVAARYRDASVATPARFGLISAMLGDPRELLADQDAARVVATLMPLLDRVRELFRAAAAAGALQPGDDGQRTVAFWASLHGAAQLRKLERFAPSLLDPDRLNATVVNALLRGWGAPAHELARAHDRVAAWEDSANVETGKSETRNRNGGIRNPQSAIRNSEGDHP